MLVVELAGSDGSEQWRTVVGTTTVGGAGLAIASDGDPAVAAEVNDLLRVVRLEGSDGAEVWSHDFAASGADETFPSGVSIDPAGDVRGDREDGRYAGRARGRAGKAVSTGPTCSETRPAQRGRRFAGDLPARLVANDVHCE